MVASKVDTNTSISDHVFFFSYAQSKQKGEVLGMWSDADALADINTMLISNFIDGVKLAGLTPKRFVLQTGAKVSCFHHRLCSAVLISVF